MVTFTQPAMEKIKSMAPGKESGIRVMVLGGGCAGFTYDMDFEDEAQEDDLVNEQHGWNVYVDTMSLCYVDNVTVDYVESLSFTGFHFENPDAKNTCGCGSSFS